MTKSTTPGANNPMAVYENADCPEAPIAANVLPIAISGAAAITNDWE